MAASDSSIDRLLRVENASSATTVAINASVQGNSSPPTCPVAMSTSRLLTAIKASPAVMRSIPATALAAMRSR